MTKTIFLFIYLSITCQLFGQIPKMYTYNIRQADSLWKKKEYKKSARAFSLAFMTLGNNGLVPDRYNAARVWSLANVPDSAFDCLSRIINKKYFTDFRMLNYETDFNNIRSDERWKSLFDTLKVNNTLPNKRKKYPNTTISIKNTLDTTVSVYYIKKGVGKIFCYELRPMQTKFQLSSFGSSWVVRRKFDEKKIMRFTVNYINQEIEIKLKQLRRKSNPNSNN